MGSCLFLLCVPSAYRTKELSSYLCYDTSAPTVCESKGCNKQTSVCSFPDPPPPSHRTSVTCASPHTALSLRPSHLPPLTASGSRQWLLPGLTGLFLVTIHSALRPLTAHSSRQLLGTLFLESPALPHHCETCL